MLQKFLRRLASGLEFARYGFTAQQTLDLVQTLYEIMLLSYLLTDSQFITDDTPMFFL